MRRSRQSLIWLTSMITGMLLVILLPIHIFFTHVGSLDVLSYGSVSSRLSQLPIKLFYAATIVALLVHGWTGFRGILFDLNPSRSQMKAIDAAIFAIAAATLVYAVYIIVAVS